MASDDQTIDIVWKWFSYHAGQRIASFNFFVVVAAALVVAYMKCAEEGWRAFGVIVGLVGGLVSVGFALLDIRNRELVEGSRRALALLEPAYGLQIMRDSESRVHLRDSARWLSRLMPTSLLQRLTKHGLVFRTIESASAILWLVGALFALSDYNW